MARQLGVAKGTVSRALNDYTDVSEEMRQRIKSAAESMGYRPSSQARNLKRNRVESIGFVASMQHHRVFDPFLSEFLDAISRTLEKKNFDLLLATASSPADSIVVYERLLTERKVDGFIVNRTEIDDPRIAFLRDNQIPFVAHGRTANPEGYAYWDIDNEQTFVNAVEHVVSLGHQRIGFLGGYSQFNFARLRRDGYRRGLAEAGLEFDPVLEVEVETRDQSAPVVVKELMAQANPPTALLAVTDAIAFGAMKVVADLGLEIGTDISVLGYDGILFGEVVSPPLTTYSQSIRRGGERIAEMIVEILNGASPNNLQELDQALLVKRFSDGPPAVSPAALAEKIALAK